MNIKVIKNKKMNIKVIKNKKMNIKVIKNKKMNIKEQKPVYPWVSNVKKEERAIAALKLAGQPVTEKAVKALYVRYGGLVLPTSEDEPVRTKQPT